MKNYKTKPLKETVYTTDSSGNWNVDITKSPDSEKSVKSCGFPLKSSLITLLTTALLLNPFASKKANADTDIFKLIKFGVGGVYEHNINNPAEDYQTNLSNDFRNGKYTFKTPIPDWKSIEFETKPYLGLNGHALFNIWDNLWIGPSFTMSTAKIESDYDNSYDIYDAGMTIPTNFKRKERIDINRKSPGLKLVWELGKYFNITTSGNIDFYNVRGNVDYEDTVKIGSYTSTLWRDASYKGKTKGYSGEIGLEANTYNIVFGVSAGYRKAKVETKGEEKITTDMDPNFLKTETYSPEFDFSGPYVTIFTGLRF